MTESPINRKEGDVAVMGIEAQDGDLVTLPPEVAELVIERLVWRDEPLATKTGKLPTASSWKAGIAIAQTDINSRKSYIKRLEGLRALCNYPEDPELARDVMGAMSGTSRKRTRSTPIELFKEHALGWAVETAHANPLFEDVTEDNYLDRYKEIVASMDVALMAQGAINDVMELWIDEAMRIYKGLRSLERGEQEEAPEITFVPPEEKKTKAAGKMCFKAGCTKTEHLIKDGKTGHAWCKRHAPKRLRRS